MTGIAPRIVSGALVLSVPIEWLWGHPPAAELVTRLFVNGILYNQSSFLLEDRVAQILSR